MESKSKSFIICLINEIIKIPLGKMGDIVEALLEAENSSVVDNIGRILGGVFIGQIAFHALNASQ